MTLRCRPGDIAVLVRPRIAENLGALVEVLHPRAPGYWRVRSLGRPLLTVGIGYRLEVTALDCRLRPIRPDADPVDVETRAPVEASTC